QARRDCGHGGGTFRIGNLKGARSASGGHNLTADRLPPPAPPLSGTAEARALISALPSGCRDRYRYRLSARQQLSISRSSGSVLWCSAWHRCCVQFIARALSAHTLPVAVRLRRTSATAAAGIASSLCDCLPGA